ncbi:DUF1707 SHOCT-like domain-containing protein [Amycolatopsis palatopharyngis]|uniref:DUF1707 SHOCT-like domain-containing protein n=1 Tax=Amycolatopsis palatopharyngis TaxID=187982 RepID=UPI001B868927|nr:DUF1707 domain-containing protein [Amycolatopsis palatopharyngis]
MVPADQPHLRLSDDERQDALDALSEHVRTGRLDIGEFGDRSSRVTGARTRGDLIPLFSDLPDPRPKFLSAYRPPAAEPVRRPSQPPSQRLASLAVPAAAVVAIVLFFTVAKGFWLVFLIPVAVALLAGSLFGGRGR